MMYSATMMMPGMEEGNANNFKDELKTSLKDGVKPIVDLIFDYFDKDGDGNITEQEFVMATQALEGSPQGACEAVFKVVDSNGNGKIEANEAAEFIGGMADVAGNVSDVMIDLAANFFRGPAVAAVVD